MKYIVSLVMTNTGIAKATNKPFAMTRLNVLVPFIDVDRETFQSHGTGLSTVELSVSSSCATAIQNSFNQSFQGMPIAMDLDTSLDQEGKNVVIGFRALNVSELSAEQPEPKTEPSSSLFKSSRAAAGNS